MLSKNNPTYEDAALSAEELLSKLENYCAYRERCPKEVRDKLAALGAEPDVAEQIFEVLKADKFFDEQRFAHAYAGGKFRNNNWGKVRIKQELRMRDIEPRIIELALGSIDMEVYQALLYKLLAKKLAQYAGDTKAREKSAASLIRSGFEPSLVFENLNKIK